MHDSKKLRTKNPQEVSFRRTDCRAAFHLRRSFILISFFIDTHESTQRDLDSSVFLLTRCPIKQNDCHRTS